MKVTRFADVAAPRGEDAIGGAKARALSSLERRRGQLAAGRRRVRRPSSRYEDLLLAVALGLAERRCIDSTAPELSEGERCLISGLELEVLSLKSSLEQASKWVTPAARRKARARAAKRFQTIAGEVKDEVMQRGPGVPKTQPADSRSSAGELSRARCRTLTRRGARCRNRVAENGLCGLHSRMVAAEVSDLFSNASQRPRADVPRSRPRQRPATATRRQRQAPTTARQRPGPTAVARRPPRIPASPILAARVARLATDARRRAGRITRSVRGVNAATSWSIASSVALGVATALIWSGLNGGSQASPASVAISGASPSGQQVSAGPERRFQLASVSGDAADVRDSTTRAHRDSESDTEAPAEKPTPPTAASPDAPAAAPGPAPTSAAATPAPAPSAEPTPAPAPAPPGSGGGSGSGTFDPLPDTDAIGDPVGAVQDVVDDVDRTLPGVSVDRGVSLAQ